MLRQYLHIVIHKQVANIALRIPTRRKLIRGFFCYRMGLAIIYARVHFSSH